MVAAPSPLRSHALEVGRVVWKDGDSAQMNVRCVQREKGDKSAVEFVDRDGLIVSSLMRRVRGQLSSNLALPSQIASLTTSR